ncbi:MAG: hypothetical protein L7U53_03440, partial [Candidatus Poseidoniaceae archaeon]|nr:hypothetical protein [Candidatus Poseidoniaceae archaeon]
MKTALLVENSEKSVLDEIESVRSIEEITIPVEEITKNEVIGFVHLVETIILLSELNVTVVENQSEATFRNVAGLSETTVVEEDVTIEELEIKNNTIEMIGFVLHVRMTISLSEPNATNVESLDLEETLVEEIPVVAVTETIVEDVEATEEVATAADETVI